ncbi:M24 family metallopeptidase [Paraburkholderia sp. BCC1884]|uniref:M24 family metallopeptidase n=1 Tax=Paraburkholderia sp. BCC1884 TaxID=2562668 RepID=UPI0011836901|nr:Xaa-Pro peptidase family protein [Paraburkholderia sp. BCC1884]
MNTRTKDIPPEGISTDEFLGRVAKVRGALDKAGLVGLLAFGDCWRGANIGYFTEFRPLDGVSDIANAILLLPVDGDPTLFVSDQCFDYATSVTGFEVRSLREVTQQVQAFSSRHRSGAVGLAGAAYIPADLLKRLYAGLGELRLEPTMVLAEIKAIKSDAEVALMRKAAALTDSAMAAIRDALADGRPYTERELALIADRAMLAGGADRTAFDSMVQSGPRSAYNLARPTDRILQPGDLIMTDIGARYRGYVADGGRGFTYGPASPEKMAIVAAAARAVEAGLAAARPGMAATELNAVIQQALVKSNYEQYSSEARGHGTGHGTGMDPEEEAPWIGPGNKTVLQENMVFTLKATITVPNVGGLRTERIVRLTAGGVETLDQFPMELHW